MSETAKRYDITDATGAVAQIPAYDKRETVWLRNAGPNRAYLAFNEPATSVAGFYMESGDVLIVSGVMAKRNIHFVCASGETASIYAELMWGF